MVLLIYDQFQNPVLPFKAIYVCQFASVLCLYDALRNIYPYHLLLFLEISWNKRILFYLFILFVGSWCWRPSLCWRFPSCCQHSRCRRCSWYCCCSFCFWCPSAAGISAVAGALFLLILLCWLSDDRTTIIGLIYVLLPIRICALTRTEWLCVYFVHTNDTASARLCAASFVCWNVPREELFRGSRFGVPVYTVYPWTN